jgi:hypothetical protein
MRFMVSIELMTLIISCRIICKVICRAIYGSLIGTLSGKLTQEYEKEFSKSNLKLDAPVFQTFLKKVTHCVANYPGPESGRHEL